MKRMALIILIWLAGVTAAFAQNVTVIGPITPGDCTMFSSTTIIKDGGIPCPGSGGTLNLPNGTTATTQSPFSDNTTKVATDAFVQGAISFNSTHFAAGGTTTGSANAQVVATTSPPVFSLTGNPTVTFIAGFSNTGATTLNVVSTGALNVLKKTPTGLAALVTGDIIAGQQYLATYDGTQFELQGPSQVVTAQIGANQVTNALINPGSANTIKGTLNGSTTTDLGVPSCSAVGQVLQWTSGTGFSCTSSATQAPVVASRAFAITQNLSSFSAITTLGYATPGDGGGALFKQISGNFTDSFVTATTINTNGTGCTNGTYTGMFVSGGNGNGLVGIATIAGNVLTSFQITGTGGNGYQANDILTLPSISSAPGSTVPCTTQPTIKVTAVSTPSGSFTDSVGTKFQIVVDKGNYANVLQFGAKCNWTKTAGDAGSTDDTTSIQNALNWAGAIIPPAGGAEGTSGRTLMLPAATCLASSLQIPYGVTLRGQGRYSTQLKEADSLAATAHFITICDPLTQFACFGTRLEKMLLFPGSGAANSSISMIYSNNIQQMDAVSEVFVFPGPRACIFWDHGYGGASSVGVSQTECNLNSSSTNSGIVAQYTAAVQTFRDVIIESSGYTGNGIQVNGAVGGIVVIDGAHFEGVSVPIFYNVVSGTGSAHLHVTNTTGGNGCTSLVVRQSGSLANLIKVGSLFNACTNAYNNAGTTSGSSSQIADVVF